jgi:hypothetical protein
MGRSSERERYFESKIRPVEGYREYLKALAASPYKQHRTAAVSLGTLALDMENSYEQENIIEPPDSQGARGGGQEPDGDS